MMISRSGKGGDTAMKSIGLDIGTTSLAAVVMDETGKVFDVITAEHGAALSGRPYERLQDAKKLEALCFQMLDTLMHRHSDVASVGVTGQMHGIVYLSQCGELLSPLYTWQDERGALPYAGSTCWAEYLSNVTGHPLAIGYGMVTHCVNRAYRIVPESAATFCTIQDYIAMKIAGLHKPQMDPSNAASLGMFDLTRECFDKEAAIRIGIEEEMLPEIAAAPLLGKGALGLLVYRAIGDNQAAFLGAVGEARDVALINIGTGGQITIYTDKCIDIPLLERRPFLDGRWLLVGAQLCGGRSYALLERFFRQTVQMITGDDCEAYSAMERALMSAEAKQDYPKFVTTFQGTRQDPMLRGSISEISTDNFTPLHFMYGIMHGMTQELYEMCQSYVEAGGCWPKKLVGAGNALRKNPTLCKILSDTFKCDFNLSAYPEEAACGAARYALFGGRV